MTSGRSRRSLSAVLIAAACLAALVPGQIGRAYSAPIDAKLAKQLSAKPVALAGTFVHFTSATPFLDGVERVTSNGLKIGAQFRSANAVYAYGLPAMLQRLRADARIARLEFPGSIKLDNETHTYATRARTLHEQTGGIDLRVPAPGGGYVDGTGVGVAIVDSGISAEHPDLDWCGDGPAATCKTVLNFKISCSVPLNITPGSCPGPVAMRDVPDSDTSSGHGTHVAGIAAGTGGQSNGLYAGVAPGAKLYGFGSGEGDSILLLNAAIGYQWIIDHHADPLGNGTAPVAGAPADPPIKVINNSFGDPSDYDANGILTQLATAAVGQGITVVWAAGNSGGTGGRDCTDTLQEPVPCTGGDASNPTPGNISVANYDDAGTGSRDNMLESDSSRGVIADPATWPDISAPGSLITSTCTPLTVICLTGAFELGYPGLYSTLSGTSMASPHVTGIVALLNQAKPNITPAQVEDVLQDTAHKFTAGAAYTSDPQNPDGTSSFDKGAGLADARAAVLAAEGLPSDYGVQTTGPSVTIDTPADGGTTGATFTASGNALSRTTGGPTPSAPILADETGQLDHVIASMDLQTLRMSEPGPGLLQVAYTVKSDAGAPAVSHSFDLFYAHEYGSGRLDLSWDPSTNALTCDQITNDGTTNSTIPLPSCVAAHAAPNTFTLTFPVADILNGAPVVGTVLRGLWVGSYLGVLLDELPGGVGSSIIHPERAKPYVLSGGVNAPGIVEVSVDGLDPVAAIPGTGAFGWSANVGPLSPGTHTLRASLKIDGVEVAADTTTFTSS